ncbi:hypothetical protein [Streptomyces sp. NPDC047706]|uniref:hypothetical protein n=1 Tax=Streptomyces sp. NPDC047706 TaxID=3365486 RepID=UPI00371017E1
MWLYSGTNYSGNQYYVNGETHGWCHAGGCKYIPQPVRSIINNNGPGVKLCGQDDKNRWWGFQGSYAWPNVGSPDPIQLFAWNGTIVGGDPIWGIVTIQC